MFQLQAKFVKTSTRILNINSSGELFSKTSMVYNAIAETPGDFANQNKKKPTKTDIEYIDTVIEKLVHQHLGQSNRTLDRFWTLWIVKFGRFSVIAY